MKLKHKIAIGFTIPISIMLILLFNTNFHPAIRFIGFWSAIPVYLYIIYKNYKRRKYKNGSIVVHDNNYQENEEYNIQPTVSHIQKKTTTTNTNTTVTTETIFFREVN